MTNTIEKNKRRRRNPPRGILTPTEKERLRKGNISRQLVSNIRRKTWQAIIVDLPLIFEKISMDRLMYHSTSKQFLKATLRLYLNLTKSQMINERRQQGVKNRVSSDEVWSRMRKETEDT